MRELLNIFLISALILTIYISIKVIRERRKAKRKVFSHFRFDRLNWNAVSNTWQLHLELYKPEQLIVKALDAEKTYIGEDQFDLNKGDLIIGLESKNFKFAKFVEVSSKDKTYLKKLA